MLPLPLFQHHAPQSIEEAVGLLGDLGDRAQIIAGGTDLLPNMKHGLFEPEHVISLGRIDELDAIIEDEEGRLVIGAMTRLHTIAESEVVQRIAPALAEAAGLVGGPHHRRMGTLGGNVCLDTRCVYYNQTYFWREALGFCLKKDGTECHVVASGKNCVAAASNDSAPALMVLDADIMLVGPAGRRTLAADDFYTTDGIYNTVKRKDELVTFVRIPARPRGKSAFEKIRRRGAIDFPLLNCAVRADHAEDGRLEALDMVVSTLAARPKRIKAAARLDAAALPDGALTDAVIGELAEAAFKQCKPLTNIVDDPAWRRDMVRVVARRALERVR
jgi:4-hydroxybenzoyl-CoA reductase subunit beta